MPADVPLMIRAWLLCAALALAVCSRAEGGPGGSESHPAAGDPWDRALALAIEHTPQARDALREIAAAPPAPEAGKLAEVLLEEWNLPATDEALRKPRLVDMPKIDWKGLPKIRGSLPVIVLKAKIDERGFVRDPFVDNRSPGDPWGQRALERFSHARFRPARDGHGFITLPYQFLVTAHP